MYSNTGMNVIKRDGRQEEVYFDKVLERIQRVSTGLTINSARLAQLVLAEIHDGVRTTELDELSARLAISFLSTHPDWGILASRIIISNCQKNAPATFTDAMEELMAMTDARGVSSPALNNDTIQAIRDNAETLNAMVRPESDYLLDYFGFKTLERAYLMRNRDKKIVETPQYMWLRVAVGIWGADMVRVRETYELMSTKAFTHATPTLFNSGGLRPQLSSCFLVAMKDDSIDGIFDTLKQCAQISKFAGGIGLHVHNIRAQGSFIAGTQGFSNGLVPMLRVFNNTARYVDQGGGRRNGSFAVYLEPWHADVQSFLKMKSNTGSEEERARDLFYALWIPDLFMRRVETGADWSLFCPHEAPGLADVHGAEFDRLYERYEREGKARRRISAQKLWSEILVSQIETGTPYLLYKDAANAKSNQKNLGTIKSSNLCVAPETIVETYDVDEWRGIPMAPYKRHSVPIHELENQHVCVWNGTNLSMVQVRKTGVRQKLMKVTIAVVSTNDTENDKGFSTLYCTEYHKFLLHSENRALSSHERVTTMDLLPGMRLCDWTTQDGLELQQRVISVEDTGRLDDTYCYEELYNHTAVFNGLMTGNCTEIMEYSSPEETAVCNLASIALPYFLEGTSFNFDKLRAVTSVIVRNLNRVIDINYYPTPETKRSNLRHRPIGIGIQGLADIFAVLGLQWESPQASELNQRIFEHIYYAALDTSNYLALQDGAYASFEGSPISQGILQPDLWNKEPLTKDEMDWTGLRERVKKGVRNSLLLAPMPTASTSQILGYNECMEPFTSNIYARRTLAGEFTVINNYLVNDLLKRGLWNNALKDRIVAANGSVQGIDEIPADVKALYKTVWEIKQKTLIDMAADRGAFICQSQSLNLFVQDPTIAKLSSMHFYAWKKGLKTGIYYLRTKSAVQAIKFTIDPTVVKAEKTPEECLLCSS